MIYLRFARTTYNLRTHPNTDRMVASTETVHCSTAIASMVDKRKRNKGNFIKKKEKIDYYTRSVIKRRCQPDSSNRQLYHAQIRAIIFYQFRL